MTSSSTTTDRPALMRVDEAHCTECAACIDLAPVIEAHRQGIPISPATLDAMSECPTGAIVWVDPELSELESNTEDE